MPQSRIQCRIYCSYIVCPRRLPSLYDTQPIRAAVTTRILCGFVIFWIGSGEAVTVTEYPNCIQFAGCWLFAADKELKDHHPTFHRPFSSPSSAMQVQTRPWRRHRTRGAGGGFLGRPGPPLTSTLWFLKNPMREHEDF